METATPDELRRLDELRETTRKTAAKQAADAISAAPTTETGIIVPPHVARELEQERQTRERFRIPDAMTHAHLGPNRAARRRAAKAKRR